MNLERLKSLVELSVENKEIDGFYGEYYSPYYKLMELLASELDGNMVELGVFNGRGSYSLAKSGKRAIGIDSHNNSSLDGIKDKFPNFMFYNISSSSVPDEIKTGGKSVAVLHIDTEHSYSMAKMEFELYQPFLKSGAVVLFDDLHAGGNDVKRYFDELNYPKVEDDRLHSCGYGVLIYE
jgi:hypothetical protein